MDDIKNLEMGEEEEGGWAGHHEEVDYSKEVVFSDSSDEESSVKRSNSNNKEEEYPSKVLEHNRTDVKDEPVSRSGCDHWEGVPPPELWGVVDPHGDKSSGDHRDRRRHPIERERRVDSEVQRLEATSHPPYLQRPGPYPSGPTYPPNFGTYPIYPPQFGPRPIQHYPPQHMVGGNKYSQHRGGGGSKRSYPERDNYKWASDRDVRGVMKRKWDDKEMKPTILAKSDKRVSSVSPQDKTVQSVTAGEASEPLLQRKTSTSSDGQEVGGKSVMFAEVEEEVEMVEQQTQPTRRGNQPKIMLRKFGEKELEGSTDRYDGKEKPRNVKGLRPTSLRGVGETDGSPGTASTVKAKTAWNVKERGPITSPKTLYEPEGKKSADKFKKYHAQTQEPPRRVSKAELEEEKTTSPVERERKEGSDKSVETTRKYSDPQRPQSSEKDLAENENTKSYPERPEGVRQQVHEHNRHSSHDKPHHRKEDSRRPKGGVDRKHDTSTKPEPKQDNVRRPKDYTRKENQDNNVRTGGSRQSERRHSDQKPHEERVRKKDLSGVSNNSREDLERGRGGGDRRPRKESGRSYTDGRGSERTGSRKTNEHDSVSTETKVDRQQQGQERNSRGNQQVGGNKAGVKKGAVRQERGAKVQNERSLQRVEKPKAPSLRNNREIGEEGDDEARKKKEKVHSRYGYTEVIDIESSSESETSLAERSLAPPQALATNQVKSSEREESGPIGKAHPLSPESSGNYRPRSGTASSSRTYQPSGGHGNKKPWRQRDEKRRDKKVDDDWGQEHPRRGSMGRGRVKEKRESGRSGGHHQRHGEEQRKHDKHRPSSGKEECESGGGGGGESTESSGSLLKFDVSKYDLNSHKVAIVDEIGSQNLHDGPLSPSVQAEFVEVTSKKTQKEKMRKEKEEQRKEEEKLKWEEQKKKRKNTPIMSQGGVEKPDLSPANKPYSAWSTSESKSEEIWSAAPGSHLKPVGSQGPWVLPILPTSVPFGIGSVGESKAAMPHTAELVSSDADIISSHYSLFGTLLPVYTPFSTVPSTTTMLDAAVDSTIGTVSSPRAVASHTPLIIDPSSAGIDSPIQPSVESSSLSESNTTKLLPPSHTSLHADVKPKNSTKPLGDSLHTRDQMSGGISKNLPPRLKPGSGRGRGSGSTGGNERRDKRKGRPEKEHVGTSEKVPPVKVC